MDPSWDRIIRQEPERHRKLQTLAQEDKYLTVVIVGKLNQLSLGFSTDFFIWMFWRFSMEENFGL